VVILIEVGTTTNTVLSLGEGLSGTPMVGRPSYWRGDGCRDSYLGQHEAPPWALRLNLSSAAHSRRS
jgi:hypothetical protein